MANDDSAAWFFGGAGMVLTLSAWLRSERRKSRAEKDDPIGTIALAEEVHGLLDDVVLSPDGESEATYHVALGSFLEGELDAPVEWEPSTLAGRPDLLIGDRVALELKFNPSKAEIDRCIGQVHGFAEEWMTILVLFGTPVSRVRRVRESLDRAGLQHVPIVDFD